jgi:hypothetical protein
MRSRTSATRCRAQISSRSHPHHHSARFGQRRLLARFWSCDASCRAALEGVVGQGHPHPPHDREVSPATRSLRSGGRGPARRRPGDVAVGEHPLQLPTSARSSCTPISPRPGRSAATTNASTRCTARRSGASATMHATSRPTVLTISPNSAGRGAVRERIHRRHGGLGRVG